MHQGYTIHRYILTPICFAELGPRLWYSQSILFCQADPPTLSVPSSHSPPLSTWNNMKKTFRGAALKTKQIQTSTWITWTACKRKDRLLSEPSTMALLTCRHWTAMVRSTMQHYACSPSCVAMIFSSNQKVCEVYNTLESPVFRSSPSEQIMNFFPLRSSLSETSQVKWHHLLSLLLFVGAKKNLRSHLGSFARSFTFQARTFQQDSIHCSRARLHGKVHC